MFGKNTFSGFLGKGLGSKLIGGVKGLARVLDEPIVNSIVSSLAPEAGAAINAAKRYGLLERIKH